MHKRIQLQTTNENDVLYISKTVIDESFTTTKHSHPNLEILFVTDGKGEVNFENQNILIEKNDILLINRDVEHYEINIAGLSFYALGIKNYEVFMEKFSDQFRKIPLKENVAKQISSLYESTYFEAENKYDSFETIILNNFLNLSLILKRYFNLSFNKVAIKNESRIVTSCKRLIENYFYEEMKLDEIAKRLSVSKSYLCHKFKEELGMSIISYKLLVQLQEAKNLLLITDMSILQIRDSVGFNSSAYFNKAFKKQFKTTPKEYKKLAKENIQI